MKRTWFMLAVGLLLVSGTGCDIVKETIEQTITEQSIRIGDELEEIAREKAGSVREGAMSAAFGGEEAEAAGTSDGTRASEAGGPPRKPNEETFSEFN